MKHKWCELRSRGCRLQRDRDVRVCVFIQGKNNTEKKRTETQQHSNLFWWDVMFAKEREIWVLEEWEKNWMKQRPDWWWWKGQNGKFESSVIKKDNFAEEKGINKKEKRGFFFSFWILQNCNVRKRREAYEHDFSPNHPDRVFWISLFFFSLCQPTCVRHVAKLHFFCWDRCAPWKCAQARRQVRSFIHFLKGDNQWYVIKVWVMG